MQEISFYSPINDFYKKFFDKFEEINTIPKKDWKVNHILSYFCKKYYEHYKVNYKFKFNVPQPSKCFEVFQVKRLGENLSKDPLILVDYIDWIFSYKIKEAKRKITSISYLTNEENLKYYKLNVVFSKQETVGRTTKLQDKWLSLFDGTDYFVETYGDLAFLYKANTKGLSETFAKMAEMGFDFELLTQVV